MEDVDSTIIIQDDDKTYSISKSDNQEINPNVSSIDLTDCERKLKEKNNIDDSLIILKVDLKIEIRTSVQYNIYNPNTYEKLYLSKCSGDVITVNSPINFDNSINEKYEKLDKQNYDLFNSNDSFYNDICTQFTSDSNTDSILSDRKNDYYNNSLELCEDGCNYKGYENIKIFETY